MFRYAKKFLSVYSWLVDITSSTSRPPTTGIVLVVVKVNRVQGWDQISLADTPAALIFLSCGYGRLSSGGRALGTLSIGSLSVKPISLGSVALPAHDMS